MEERRKATRYYPKGDTQAVFNYDSSGMQLMARSSRVWDISNKGCCFQSKNIVELRPRQVGKLELKMGRQIDEVGDARIERIWEDGIAVSFKPTNKTEKYCGKEKKAREDYYEKESPILGFAQRDYDVVHREIIDIKSCRTNLFLGTLGILGAVGTAILGIIGISRPQPWQASFLGIFNMTFPVQETSWHNWLFWASFIPVVLLVCAILSTIHKARGLNMRTGYMEALGECLAEGEAPTCWKGWMKAKQVVERCKIYMRVDIEKIEKCKLYKLQARGEAGGGENCGAKEEENKLAREENIAGESGDRNSSKEGRTVESERLSRFLDWVIFWSREKGKVGCFVEGKKNSVKTTEAMTLLPSLLHSFTALTTYIYGLFLIASSVILIVVLMNIIESHIPTKFNRKLYVLVVLCGGALSLMMYGARGLLPKGDGAERKRPIRTRLRWAVRGVYMFYTKVCVFGMPLVLFVLFLRQIGRVDTKLVIIAYTLGALIPMGAVLLICYFREKVDELRRGKDSPERWRHVWKLCFEYCPLMRDETPC